MGSGKGEKMEKKMFIDVLFLRKRAKVKYSYCICNQVISTAGDFQSDFQ